MEPTSPSEPPSSEQSRSSGDSLDERLGNLPHGAPRLDRHVLLEPAGQGNFAAVWSAYDPQLDRKVAIKILRLRERADLEAEQERLLNEAQMLARLSHPNVVAIHDVRPLDDPALGRGLFIVMEYLAGPTLATWMATEQPRPWSEVVEVFVEAGRGLAAAHAQGMVHRDFKPANVMFGADRRVRVLDFGLAAPVRLPGEFESQSGEPDRPKHRFAGTPIYMAPEQHLGKIADARSDQFSFAIALFEALYGRRPFIGTDHAVLARAKSQKQIQYPPRGFKVPGHLHAVLDRALSPLPDERFPDMAALLRELERDPTLERRRWLISGALAVTLAASGYAIAQLQNHPPSEPSCAPPADVFAGVWDESIRAEIRDRFTDASPWSRESLEHVESRLDAWTSDWQASYSAGCAAERAREPNASFDADDPVRRCLEQSLRRTAGLTGILREADQSTLARANEVTAALEHPIRCLRREAPLVGSSEDTDQHRTDILALEIELARASALLELGLYEDAQAMAEPVVDQAIELGDPAGESRGLLVIASAQRRAGDAEEAIATGNRAIAAAFRSQDPNAIVRALLVQVESHDELGRRDAARALAEIAEDFLGRGLHDRALEIDLDLSWGRMLFRADDWVPARKRLLDALAGSLEIYGDDHPKLATIETLLGVLAAHQSGKPEDSLEYFERALQIRRRTLGDHHPLTAESLANRAGTLQQLDAIDEAEADYRAALDVLTEARGADSLAIVPVTLSLVRIDLMRGRMVEADRRLEHALPIAEKGWGPTHSWMTEIYPLRATVHAIFGRHAEAVADLRRSLVAHQHVHGASNPNTALAQAELAAGLRRQADALEGPEARKPLLDEADLLERLAIEQWSRALPEDVWLQGMALGHRSRIARIQGRPADALADAEQLVAYMRETAIAGADGRAIATTHLAASLIDLQREREAIERIDAILADVAAVGVEARLELLELHAKADVRLGDRAGAIDRLEQALALCSGEQASPAQRQHVEQLLEATREAGP